MYLREYKSEFIKTIEVQDGIICEDRLKEGNLKPLELKTVLIYEIPVYKMTKKDGEINRSIAHIRLLTNGKIINVKFHPHSRSYAIPNEIFEHCFVSVTSKETNRKLFKMIE